MLAFSRRRLTIIAALGLALYFVAAAAHHPARAQTMQVTITDFQFTPATITVPVGSTVTWMNQGPSAHTSTSDSGVWNSGTLAPGQSFSFTFNQPGTYPYHCMIHPFMHGTIVVQSAATTSPTSAATTGPTSAVGPTSAAAATSTPIPLAANPVGAKGMPELHMGPSRTVRHTAWLGFYDGHKDTYLNTDVSNKAQAASMHINLAPGLRSVPMGSAPAIYLVKGRAVANQLAVFGSQPGESDYSPVWHEVVVTWKRGVRPVLLTSDNQIANLVKKGKLTMRPNHVMLNCPIIKVSK